MQLQPEHAQIVRKVFGAVLPGAQVWVFGSRATGKARPFSDLDLLVTQPPKLTWAQRADLSDAFEESALPFLVDVVPISELAPGFAQRVHGERVAL